MPTNWNAMQVVQTMDRDGKKVRHAPGDVNLKQLSRGAWKASLSNEGRASGLKGITHGDRPVKRK